MESATGPSLSKLASTDDEDRVKETEDPASDPAPKKPGSFKRAWSAIGLDLPTLMISAKGALAPVLTLAILQSPRVAKQYGTLGYLVVIMSLVGFAIQPRAKFIQTMTVNILFTCIGAAVALLQFTVVVSARQATTPPTPPHGTAAGGSGSQQALSYNGAASACAAIGLFVTIYVVSFLKAKLPQLTLSVIVYAIFTAIASVYSPGFPNMTAAELFAKNLLKVFLTGFGMSAAVSFLVIPMTSRMIFTKKAAGFIQLLQLSLRCHADYVRSISPEDVASRGDADVDHVPTFGEKVDESHGRHHFHHTSKADSQKQINAKLSKEATAMKDALFKIGALYGTLLVEAGFAKREMAFGKLGPEDFSEIARHLRDILVPVVGMASFIDIMESVKGKDIPDSTNDFTVEAIEHLRSEDWAEVFDLSRNQFKAFHQAMQNGLTHISYVLELEKKPKQKTADVEKVRTTPSPGDEAFGRFLEEEIQKFYKHREEVLQMWCESKGIKLPHAFWNDPSKQYSMKDLPRDSTVRQGEYQQQLYLILYLRYLAWSTGKAILSMAQFADSKVADGTMKKKRFIFPGVRRIKKLFENVWSQDDTDLGIDHGQSTNIYMGDSLKARKDPEHLPPANAFEKATNHIRTIPKILASEESSFAFRCAVATMSLGVLAFLRQTRTFFLDQRLMWALIMLAISLTADAGQSISQFLLKVLGTVVAMCVSIVVWYMCDQKPAAIIPVLFPVFACGFFVVIKFPKYSIVAILSMATIILIIGYELQVDRLGVKIATSNGQPHYPIYELAPYRLATVIVGLFVAFFWTYFPYPVTTHATLRKELGGTLYLMANFYSCVHSTMEMRLKTGIKADPTDKKSPTHKLDKARLKVFSKMVVMLNKLRERSKYTKFEPTFGGKFPKKTYDELIDTLQKLFNYMALTSYSSISFTEDSANESEWLRDFRRVTGDVNLTSHDITSSLCLVSASITNSQPLPPYLRAPRPFDLGSRLEEVDPELLSMSHISQPCYSAFAVLEIASTLIAKETAHVVRLVRELVGEVDFTFHIISTKSDDLSLRE